MLHPARFYGEGREVAKFRETFDRKLIAPMMASEKARIVGEVYSG
jgi:hypothetical protein